MDERDAYVQKLLETFAERRDEHDRKTAHWREVFLRQAREAAAKGEKELAARSRRWALDAGLPQQKYLDAREQQLREWLDDPLVWVRPTLTAYATIYHRTKECGNVQKGYPSLFRPRLEGEVKGRMRACTAPKCRRVLWVRDDLAQVAAA
ncbi:hypothetical protein [Streptomyces sp. NPDC054958]